MDIPSQIDLKIGESYSLRLQGRSAAGYTWTFHVTGDEQAIHVSTKKASLEASSGDKTPVPGISADEIVTIQALTPGVATLHLMQQRLWERQKLSDQEQTIEVHVQQ